jgi:hypothetical protein
VGVSVALLGLFTGMSRSLYRLHVKDTMKCLHAVPSKVPIWMRRSVQWNAANIKS